MYHRVSLIDVDGDEVSVKEVYRTPGSEDRALVPLSCYSLLPESNRLLLACESA